MINIANIYNIIFTIPVLFMVLAGSYNFKIVISSTVCINDLIGKTKCDISVISEHKLKPESLSPQSSLESGYNCIAKADKLAHNYKAFHGKGGVCILCKSSLQFELKEIYNMNSDRIVGIEIKDQSVGSIFIFGVYLHFDKNIELYRDEINALDVLCSYYENYSHVIVAGDMNASCL